MSDISYVTQVMSYNAQCLFRRKKLIPFFWSLSSDSSSSSSSSSDNSSSSSTDEMSSSYASNGMGNEDSWEAEQIDDDEGSAAQPNKKSDKNFRSLFVRNLLIKWKWSVLKRLQVNWFWLRWGDWGWRQGKLQKAVDYGGDNKWHHIRRCSG